MLLPELKAQVIKLPPSERLALVTIILESLRDPSLSKPSRSGAIRRMRGLLKTDQPAPTDEQVTTLLEERRAEKYLQ